MGYEAEWNKTTSVLLRKVMAQNLANPSRCSYCCISASEEVSMQGLSYANVPATAKV